MRGSAFRLATRRTWPVVAVSLLLNCPIWTEDQDFFRDGYCDVDYEQDRTLSKGRLKGCFGGYGGDSVDTEGEVMHEIVEAFPGCL